jgi:hypothetical protein
VNLFEDPIVLLPAANGQSTLLGSSRITKSPRSPVIDWNGTPAKLLGMLAEAVHNTQFQRVGATQPEPIRDAQLAPKRPSKRTTKTENAGGICRATSSRERSATKKATAE